MNDEILNEAKEMYLNSNSSIDIAEYIQRKYKISISDTTVRKWLKKIIKLRNRQDAVKLAARKHLPIDEIIRLYDKELKSANSIAKTYGSTKTTIKKILKDNGINIRLVHDALKLTNQKYYKKAFDGDKNELAYVMGFVKGDVTAYQKSEYTIALITNSTIESFVELFKLIFSKYGNVKISRCKRNQKMWQMVAYLDSKSFRPLIEIKNDVSCVNNFSGEAFINFLAGFIDAEGSILLKKIRNNFQYSVRIYNEDLLLLNILKQRLEKLGFKPHLDLYYKKGEKINHGDHVSTYNKDYYNLEISNRKDVIKLLEILPIRHSQKLLKREFILELHNRGVTRWDNIFTVEKSLPFNIAQRK